MPDGSPQDQYVIPDRSPVQINFDSVKRRFPGYTNNQIAKLAGISLRTLDRVRKHPERSRLGTILNICEAAGLPINELITERAA